MSKEKIIVAICALALGLFLIRGMFSTSEEKAIEKLLDSIQYELEFNEPLKPLNIASRLNSLKGLVRDDISIRMDLKGTSKSFSGFDAIKAGAMAGSRLIKSSSIHRLATVTKVLGDSASANFVALASGLDSSGDKLRERFHIQADFIKVNGDWVLSEISVSKDTN